MTLTKLIYNSQSYTPLLNCLKKFNCNPHIKTRFDHAWLTGRTGSCIFGY